MRRRRRREKTSEQIEQKREAAREALRRHRARRKAQLDAMLGTPAYSALRRIQKALRDMTLGTVEHWSRRIVTRDRFGSLASGLFDALGPERTAKLIEALAEEVDTGGTRARRAREFVDATPTYKPEERT